MLILSWNCQKARGKSFRLILKNYSKLYNPFLVVLIEPRINGEKVKDLVIKLGFASSYRVEANGFSNGIWLFCSQNTDVKVMTVHC